VSTVARTRPALADDLAFLILVGALTTLPPLSTDIMLPGLPVIGHALGATSATMQHSLSVFIFAFGLGQLILGPLSDRYGRRPVLIAGLSVYVLAGLGCTFATNGTALVIGRLVQGFGACAGTMSAFAIVQDVSPNRDRAASLQAFVSSVTSVAPIVAPLLGAAILVALNWRWLYGALALAGIALIAAVVLRLPETAPGTTGRGLSAYARVLRLPRTVPLALFVACSFGAYFALITGSPFALVTQMHVSGGLYAVCFALNACALMAGAFTTGRLAPRIGAERLFAYGVVLLVIAGAAACAFDVFAPSPVAFVATFMLFAFSAGIVMPSAFAAGLAGAGADTGTTSAVLGASQMLGGGAGSALAAAIPFVPSAGIGVTVLGAAILAAIAYLASTVRSASR
jgi:DHA1 family bicyclomycin/chloramphenicol resistance-like MFS transporter